jgi:HEAT repeat protein
MANENILNDLLAGLDDTHPLNRKQAIQGLANLGDKSVIPKLLEIILNDPASSVRQTAAQAFQKGLSDRSAVDTLIKALKDPDASVRGAAAAALGTIKDKAAVPDLCLALKDESEHVRWSVVCNLAKIGDKAAIGALTELIANPEEILNIKDAAREAFRQLRLS